MDLARKLLPILERKADRILVKGYPNNVEVSHAMVHGGRCVIRTYLQP